MKYLVKLYFIYWLNENTQNHTALCRLSVTVNILYIILLYIRKHQSPAKSIFKKCMATLKHLAAADRTHNLPVIGRTLQFPVIKCVPLRPDCLHADRGGSEWIFQPLQDNLGRELALSSLQSVATPQILGMGESCFSCSMSPALLTILDFRNSKIRLHWLTKHCR